MTDPRSYHQHCGLARSLDLLGERWTLLIVRELDRGPKRFRDLEAALKGIGTNLLAARLKRLEAMGAAERAQLAPGVPAYALTASGEQLAVALEDLSLWGMDRLGTPAPEDQTRAAWAAMGLRARVDRAPGPRPHGTYAFAVGDERFWLRVGDGRTQVRDGVPPYEPDARLTTTKREFFGVVIGQTALEHVDAGIDGDGRRLRELLARGSQRAPTAS